MEGMELQSKCLCSVMNHISLCYDFTVSSHYATLKGLRSCCLTRDYGRMGSKGLTTWTNLPLWFREVEHQETGELQQVQWALSTAVRGFHSSHLAYATVNQGVGGWQQGSELSYYPFVLSQDPKCEQGLNLLSINKESDWPKTRRGSPGLIPEVVGI
jgi:hypothetical protein